MLIYSVFCCLAFFIRKCKHWGSSTWRTEVRWLNLKRSWMHSKARNVLIHRKLSSRTWRKMNFPLNVVIFVMVTYCFLGCMFTALFNHFFTWCQCTIFPYIVLANMNYCDLNEDSFSGLFSSTVYAADLIFGFNRTGQISVALTCYSGKVFTPSWMWTPVQLLVLLKYQCFLKADMYNFFH